jgi:hypothetical protein
MKRIHRYNLLSLFGDMKPKQYIIALQLATLHFANPLNRTSLWGSERLARNVYMSEKIEKMFKQLLEYGLIKRVKTEAIKQSKTKDTYLISLREYDLQLTEKGRDCLGSEQVERSGDYSWYGRSGFDGTTSSAAKINPGLFK